MKKLKHYFTAGLGLILLVLFVSAANAQTTEFTYQGKLNDGAAAANASYDFEFKLYDSAAAGGNLLGTQTRLGVAVTGGVFTVSLDFGAQFSGAARFLEISVKPAGSANAYTPLLPRQPFTSAPYSIKSLNAATADNANSLGGIPANQFVQTTDARLFDARNPLANSANYIQNTTTQQMSSGFNISGNGTVGGTVSGNLVNAVTQYNFGGSRVLKISGGGLGPVSNTFVGIGAGQNSAPTSTNGLANSFFGNEAGISTTIGNGNSFFGYRAGASNNGSDNSFFGSSSGNSTSSTGNSFFGASSGTNNTIGQNNTFIGGNTGTTNTDGSNNTLIGYNAEIDSQVSFGTAIGAQSRVLNSNTIALGREDGSDKVVIYGLGSAGSTALCRNASRQVSTCSSSLRYKTNVKPFDFGLNLVNRLKPISFDWKDGGTADFGLGAEDVAAVEPLLVTYNEKGEVEGVKYDRIGVVLLNAVKEQQEQIEVQAKQNDEQKQIINRQSEQLNRQEIQLQKQRSEIDALKILVCSQNPAAQLCQPKNEEKEQ